MRIKSVTWNIGGGKVLQQGADPLLMGSYSVDGLDEITAWLRKENPDIITLQETQRDDTVDQVVMIATDLGYEYYYHDSTSESHIDIGCKLGHGILSRYPLVTHTTGLFINPKVSVTWEDGSTATSHDKGYTTCTARVGDKDLAITTLHLVPFKAFKIDPRGEQGTQILDNVAASLVTTTPSWIIQGDFNIDGDTLASYLPTLFAQGVEEVATDQPTTPKGHRCDRALFRRLTLNKSRIDSSVMTDHFPVVAEFEY